MKSRHFFFLLAAGLCVTPLTAAQAQNLDVKGTITGEGTASFWQNVGIGTSNPGNKLTLFTSGDNDGLVLFGNGSRETRLMTNLGNGSYNPITLSGDRGLFYSADASKGAGGFVVAPWATGMWGIRLDAVGNVMIGTNVVNNIHANSGYPWNGTSLTVAGDLRAFQLRDDEEPYYLDLNVNGLIKNLTADGNVNVDGAVGIGTRAPASGFKLDVSGDVRVTGSVFANIMQPNLLRATNVQSGAISTSGLITASGGITASGTITANGPITARGPITANGFVGIGTSSPRFPIDIRSYGMLPSSVPYGYLAQTGHGHLGSFAQNLMVSLWADQRILTGAEIDVLSDAREKNVMGIIDPKWAAEQVQRLQPKTFTWKSGHEPGTKLGFIAQEVDQVVPEAVTKFAARGYDDLHVLNYDALYTINVAATKHLLGIVAEQGAAIERQQAAIAKQQAEIDQLKAGLGPVSH